MSSGEQNLSESTGLDPSSGEISFWRHTWGNLRNAIIGCSAAVLFGLVVLLMSILSVTNPSSVFPQVAATPAAEIYYLPYPGILPDNPLYNLKAIRDRVRLWLTWDEGKKAEAELLYADKRINAALALVEGGKASLGVSTATKAEKYLERAVSRAVRLAARSQLLNLEKAVAKHTETIEGLIIETTGADRVSLETTLKQTQALAEKVAQALRE